MISKWLRGFSVISTSKTRNHTKQHISCAVGGTLSLHEVGLLDLVCFLRMCKHRMVVTWWNPPAQFVTVTKSSSWKTSEIEDLTGVMKCNEYVALPKISQNIPKCHNVINHHRLPSEYWLFAHVSIIYPLRFPPVFLSELLTSQQRLGSAGVCKDVHQIHKVVRLSVTSEFPLKYLDIFWNSPCQSCLYETYWLYWLDSGSKSGMPLKYPIASIFHWKRL